MALTRRGLGRLALLGAASLAAACTRNVPSGSVTPAPSSGTPAAPEPASPAVATEEPLDMPPDSATVTTFNFRDGSPNNDKLWGDGRVTDDGYLETVPYETDNGTYAEVAVQGPGTPDLVIDEVPYSATWKIDFGGHERGERAWGFLQNEGDNRDEAQAIAEDGVALVVTRNGRYFAMTYRGDKGPAWTREIGPVPKTGLTTVTVQAVTGKTTFTVNGRTEVCEDPPGVAKEDRVALSGSPRPGGWEKKSDSRLRVREGWVDTGHEGRAELIAFDGKTTTGDAFYRAQVDSAPEVVHAAAAEPTLRRALSVPGPLF